MKRIGLLNLIYLRTRKNPKSYGKNYIVLKKIFLGNSLKDCKLKYELYLTYNYQIFSYQIMLN